MLKLFMVLVGCKPTNRNTEQHDVFFGVGETIRDIVPQIKDFWPEAGDSLHVDAYMAINQVGKYDISVIPNDLPVTDFELERDLYFVNLGGYTPPEFEEYHKKILVVTATLQEAIKESKKNEFYQEGQRLAEGSARSHIDDKIDVDEIIRIQDQLPKNKIVIRQVQSLTPPNELYVGYLTLSKAAS